MSTVSHFIRHSLKTLNSLNNNQFGKIKVSIDSCTKINVDIRKFQNKNLHVISISSIH